MNADVCSSDLLIRVIEKIEKNPKFSKKIGIKDKTKEKLQER